MSGDNLDGFRGDIYSPQQYTPEANISIGDDARKFLESTLGQVIQDKAESLIQKKRKELESVDPTDANAIRAIQTDIKATHRAMTWLISCIEDGEATRQAIIQQNEAETID